VKVKYLETNAGQNYKTLIANKSFENRAKVKYLGDKKLANQNCT
jgi:hypothetical protein